MPEKLVILSPKRWPILSLQPAYFRGVSLRFEFEVSPSDKNIALSWALYASLCGAYVPTGGNCNLARMMELASVTQTRLRCPAAQKRPHLQNLKSSRHFNSLLLILSCIAFKCFTSVDCASPKRFVVFGSSGKTGSAIVQRLLSENVPDRQIICPVRNMAKARAVLGPESKSLSVLPCDLNVDEKEKYLSIVSGADAVIICSAYSPGMSVFR